jgi:hypothetical protein
VARVHAHPRGMGPKMDSLLYVILGSLLRNRIVSPLWIRQTDTQGRGSPFPYARSLINNTYFPASSPLLSLPTAAAASSSSFSSSVSTITAKRKGTVEELEARVESNGYKRGAYREKNSAQDNGKHNNKTKKNQM